MIIFFPDFSIAFVIKTYIHLMLLITKYTKHNVQKIGIHSGNFRKKKGMPNSLIIRYTRCFSYLVFV